MLAADFDVVNWGYRSLWSPIEQHGRQLAEMLRQRDAEAGQGQIHLVAHSMGGIISRLALEEYLPQRLGRIVMIAPPNRGSPMATRLAPLLGRLCPPLAQLADHEDSFVCRLAHPQGLSLGVIAASLDFQVLEPSTHLPGEADHIVLFGTHSSLVWRRETARQVQYFLEQGRFLRNDRVAA